MGCTHDEGKFHDCRYVDARNALIPAAEQVARTAMAAMPAGPDTDVTYGAAFLRAMNFLWAARTRAPS